jgi:hypothetical protein
VDTLAVDTLLPFYRVEKIDLVLLGKDLAKREFDRRVESLEDAGSNLLDSFHGRG